MVVSCGCCSLISLTGCEHDESVLLLSQCLVVLWHSRGEVLH